MGMRPRVRSRWGYTVIELLIVMIIITVIAGITFVRMAPALERGRVRGAASVLAGDLQYAQVLAARYRKPIRVSVAASELYYQIRDRAGTVYRTRVFGPESEFNLSSFTPSPVHLEIFPNAVAAQSATYTLDLNGYQRQVTFSRAGQIRVSVP